MTRHLPIPAAAIRFGLLAATIALAGTTGAHALTMKECSAKYKEAKQGNTLNGQDWKAFRAAQCGATAKAGTAPTATPAATSPAPAPTATPKTTAAAPAASGPAVFPNAIAPKYASETAGKGRLHTCLDQYKANKADNGNGGLKWIQKGGGYYSECSKHLKG